MAELISNAEKFADKSRELTLFKNFSLPGVKDKVAEMLNMIGHVEKIFSTYTKHNIEHVDAMLKSLDWIIPPSTQNSMTSIDWLMIVLSIYLHDLGMLVTSEEFKNRMENQKYVEFLENLEKNPANKDYMARVEKIEGEDRERFFYQEYIRLNHASRIRELIQGRNTGQWGDAIKPIFDEIKKIMEDLPPRFKENLGKVCESHHEDNLDRREYFPLHQFYGGSDNASANVQYAALILRTADLLHVTKDRTPSVMFKIIGLSDPKGIDEWQKQMGVFAVNKLGKEFNPNDPTSHVIEVIADFKEERPFFALTEYISYVRQQLEQTKGWADSSQQISDAKDYWFPWYSIKGNILVEGHEPVPMKFELDRGRLLDLLVGHTIYNDATVAVRELLQNAIDAVRYQHYLEEKEQAKTGHPASPIGKVIIKWDPSERILIVEDNGTGMDNVVISSHLMKVGASFYNTPQFQQEYKDYTPISRFGIGILTNFMVSDDIEIVTMKSGGGYRIRLTSVQSDYLLKKIKSGDPLLKDLEPHGTRITVKIRSSVDFKNRSMLDIVRYWIILPACDVYFHEIGKEPELIGFKSVVDALKFFHKDRSEVQSSLSSSYSTDFRTDNYVTAKGTYDFAVKVRKGFTPEWAIVQTENTDAPVVCIEGIRADNVLPGFISENPVRSSGLCTLLSVKGNKDFRTTVSRTNLEHDNEYINVSKICVDFLITHLRNEIERIAKTAGYPLSRASSAGQWIYGSITRFISRETLSYLEEAYANTPIIVIERIGEENSRVHRELISSQELNKVEDFWTIESRLVSYLGTISRDLGKELSLNEFLGTLAPELRDHRINALVPDSSEFRKEILLSHVVKDVEFSRSNQQTMVNWTLVKDKVAWSDSLKLRNETLNLETAHKTLREIIELIMPIESILLRVESNVRQTYMSILAAPITGDLKAVHGIKTRVATILDSQKPIGQVWDKLITILNGYSQTGKIDEGYLWIILGIASLMAGFSGESEITELLGGAGVSRQTRYYAIPQRSYKVTNSLRELWKESGSQIIKFHNIDKEDVVAVIKLDLSDLIGDEENWFDASAYWWNWSRGASEF